LGGLGLAWLGGKAYYLTGGHTAQQGGPVGVFEGILGTQGYLNGLIVEFFASAIIP